MPFLRPLFLQIVPFHLLLMLFLVVINHQKPDRKFVLFILVIMVLGFAAEWIGVHKHWLFGNYVYDTALGFKADQIPLMIGLNWFLLIYSCGTLMQKIPVKEASLKILLGAIVLVLLDLLIEPVAIRSNYWHWLTAEIPLKNYTCWLLVSILMLTIFQKFKFTQQSWVAPVLLLMQFMFFAVLNFA